jgi:two-component system chemotaxis response regulator CheB
MPIRTVIVDDSATARAALAEILDDDPEIEIVGMAKDGAEAVEMARRIRPDVMTIDLVMPGMTGFDAVQAIMAATPIPLVVVSGKLDGDEVDMSMRALRTGALAVLKKPAGRGSPAFEQDSRHLVATVKSMSKVKLVRRQASRAPGPRKQSAAVTTAGVHAVAIGASTGGPAAVRDLLAALPAGFQAPILLVQHISSGFEEGYASWLDTCTPLRVKLAEDGEPLRPATVYVGAAGYHLELASRSTVRLADTPPAGGLRPSINRLFESACATFGAECAAVLLTGMGSDGAAGLKLLHDAGALTIAQSKASCVVFGMPKAAIADGAARVVLDPPAIGALLADVLERKDAR